MRDAFAPYFGIFCMRFRALLQYRTAALAGIVTQITFGLVRTMVLIAFYRYGGPQDSMTLQEAITYTWIGQAMLGLLPWNIEPEIANSVRSGEVAYELARPLDLYWMWYVRCIAQRSAPTLLKSVPQFFLALFVFPAAYRMQMPTGDALAAWAVATLGALLFAAAVTSLMNVALFWTVTGDGLLRLLPSVILLLSGMAVPLPLFPDWLQTALRIQPFAGLTDTPARLFSGNLPVSELPLILGMQIFWTVIMIVFCRWLIGRGLRRVTIAGG